MPHRSSSQRPSCETRTSVLNASGLEHADASPSSSYCLFSKLNLRYSAKHSESIQPPMCSTFSVAPNLMQCCRFCASSWSSSRGFPQLTYRYRSAAPNYKSHRNVSSRSSIYFRLLRTSVICYKNMSQS